MANVPSHVLRGVLAILVLTLVVPARAQYGSDPSTGGDTFRRFRERRDGGSIDDWAQRLSDGNPGKRLGAVKSFGESQDPKAIPYLMQAVTDPDPRVAAKAVEYLGRLRATDATDFLAERLFLKETSSPLRHHILTALGKIHDTKASRPILDLVRRESDPEMRAAGIYAIGEVGDSTIQEDLAQLAREEKDPQLKRLAEDALAKISDRRVGPTPSAAKSDNPLLRPVEP